MKYEKESKMRSYKVKIDYKIHIHVICEIF